MRLWTALLALCLLASAYVAPRHYAARAAALPVGRFLEPDARKRAKEALAARQLGVAMAAYEELLKAHPGDPDLVRDRLRVGFLAGAVALGQPKIGDQVYARVVEYLEQRDRIDPQGTFLDGVVETWIDERLHYDMTLSVYPRAAMAIFLAARGDPKGRDMLLEFTRRGAFHMQFFPFARRYRPGWPAAETLVAHYLENGDLLARIEAGVTLLDYNGLFGVGEELLARHLPAIRAAIREMLEKMRGFEVEASDATRATIIGMALLAGRGDEECLRALAAARSEREMLFYVPSTDAVRVARVWAGIDPFESMGPLTVRFKDLDTLDQELYYVAAAHRATKLAKEGGAGGPELAALLDLLESGFDGTLPIPKILAMQVLLRIAPERGATLVARALDGRGALAAYAAVLTDGVEDRVALFLPALSSPEPDVSALGAASLRDPSLPRALAR